jgi:hypothetical protein
VYVAIGRRSGYAAQREALDGKGVASTEERTYVLQRTHVVEHDSDRHLLHGRELVDRGTVQLLIGYLSHGISFFGDKCRYFPAMRQAGSGMQFAAREKKTKS